MSDTCVPISAFYEAVFLTDGEMRIVDCNDRAVELLRAKDKAAIIGRYANEIPSDYALASEFPTYLKDRLKTARFVVTECHVTRDDGSTLMAESILHRISDQQILFKLRDVTARTENLHRLEEANERLRASYRARMEFVSNVSHELRTPLTSMSYALTNMLRGICGSLSDRMKDYLERLQVDVRRLMTTVNDILDLRQIENGTLTLHKTRVPLHHILKESVDALRIQAEVKRQSLTLTPIQAELYSEADQHKLERVFFNILSNAVKYTPEEGSIVASVHREGETAVIEVDDTGIGISPEALPRVSQRYFRVGDQVTGTGLGLSIVREIAELHGGSLEIQSPVPGTTKGTRVSVKFPLCESPLVLIVSGDESFIQTLSTALQTLGKAVEVNREAIDLGQECASLTPAHFILDGTLPDACLNEFVCQIRGNARLSRVPILILTPDSDSARHAAYAQMRVLFAPYPLPEEKLKSFLL